ncbi:hypothetical protein [Lentzea sp. CC55]|uniref:hypothetical protein n=1 Tax=Lentzea sp. CC55 TaxID=2884909 RepID=UPI001F3EABCB|nr:hypothetical protein [Lentzea sp. CC55]MCG8922343.1 hypothetical protein [Lentzea sp. CC55]
MTSGPLRDAGPAEQEGSADPGNGGISHPKSTPDRRRGCVITAGQSRMVRTGSASPSRLAAWWLAFGFALFFAV